MSEWNEAHGFAVIDRCISADELGVALDEAERLFAVDGRHGAGVRRVLPRSSHLAALAASPSVHALVAAVLGEAAFVVRSILFDKTPETNWDVAWHQDTAIAVRERIETPGFGPWSVKAGVVHVRPPAELLGRMLTLRVHLDACAADAGPLLVAPGTHRQGVAAGAPNAAALNEVSVACTTEAGGVVLMRPLLFHASRKASKPSHRRVLHLEYASESLTPPLQWAIA